MNSPVDFEIQQTVNSGFPNYGFLDNVYCLLNHQLRNIKGDRFFKSGWGNHQVIDEIQSRFEAPCDVTEINVEWRGPWQAIDGVFVREGEFKSPHYSQYLPENVTKAVFKAVMPTASLDSPVCVHLATTGEEGFHARENWMAMPLARQGLGTIILEHPFMGERRPFDRSTNRFHYFHELVLFGGMVVEEVRSLTQWLYAQGATQVGLFGISSGGHLAALAAGGLKRLDVLVPCVAPHSGVVAFTEGLLSKSCDWRKLARDSNCSSKEALAMASRLLQFTGVDSLPPPPKETKIRVIAALNDRFVPPYSVNVLLDHWPLAEIHWLNGGHVSSIVKQKPVFLQAILEGFGLR